ncbi:conserved hypothetical protein [Verticillium alfalfae VaMs.102]|uniref:DUF6546 domain-containing protein n=1 Tax=Verticillium alfalfae (strain VaMs.102 / ATCC MYA-4576 / FGSC 10136) TaxID=526221 RepID=C9SRY0_VERA1|nr:conserved hypothetical protein [Verticillium alfalfae VaMs.102]EEY21545.1 conserved hypothetical protein [Verticillium alfalfae VaMs.102]
MATGCVVTRRYNTRLYTRTKIGSWLCLPTELRIIILETFARYEHPGWSTLASVCREWQYIIATKNLRKLELRSSCLESFGRLITLQRDFVRHIWLNVVVQNNTCPHYQFSQQNGPLIVSAIRKIFSILSKWKPGRGLTLELHAHRPSDQDRFFKGFYFATDHEGEVGSGASHPKWHHPLHRWFDRYSFGPPTRSAISGLFEQITLNFGQQKLPRAEVVTRLIPSWSTAHGVRAVAGVGEFAGEQSRYGLLFQQSLPATVKTLTVFEDFNEKIAEALVRNDSVAWHSSVARHRIADPVLGAIFASKSRKLERLSASFLVDAGDFFDSCIKQLGAWRRLETLALTVRLFQEETPHQEINDLLLKASEVAVRMPKLRTLVLWNGARGNACAFIFQAKHGCAFLTWRGTWDHEISRRVEEGWEQAASRIHSCSVTTKKERIRGQVSSHGDAIHLLNLPCQVVEPASLWQIRREGALPTL